MISSCTSVQKDVMISTDTDEDMSLTYDFESRIAELDAEVLENKNKDESLKKCQTLMAEINKKLSETNQNKLLESRLNAFLGRLSEIQGNITKAKQYLEEAAKKNKDEIQALILKRRLGLETNIIEKLDDFETKGLIYLESAIEAFQNEMFDISSGEFDIAFLTLPQFYRKAYNSIRDKAWNLKDTFSENVRVKTLIKQNEISLMQMVEITSQTTSLLDIYTGGKKMSDENLFNSLASAGLFTPSSQIQNVKAKKINSQEIVTRKMAARFLWNIFCTGKNFSKTKYSEKYKTKNLSPVPDILVTDSDFDAILGSVENELLILPDGLNFIPDKNISGQDFYNAIKKINN